MAVKVSNARKFPIKRNGYYHVESEELQKTLGRDKFVAVTEILSVIAKGALPYAAARKAAEIYMERPYDFQAAEEVASAVYAEWRKKAKLGTSIHSLAEALSLGTAEPIEAHEGYARAVRAFFNDVKPEPIEIEVNCYASQHGYAGTADLLAYVGTDRKITLCDFKTSPRIYDEARVQLRGYRECDWMLTNKGLLPMPKVEQTAVVLLREDGTYAFEIVDAPIGVLLAAKTIWEWQNGAKGVV